MFINIFIIITKIKKQQKMRKTILSLAMLLTSAIGIMSCDNNSQGQNRVTVVQQPQQQVPENVTVEDNQVVGFDLVQFSNLLKTTTDAQSLERAINSPNNTINTIPTPDGTAFVSVQESSTGLVLMNNSTQPASLVTNVNITSANGQATVVYANTNTAYCGDGYYQSSYVYPLSAFVFGTYFWHPHNYWYPRYSYGHYASYYHTYRPYHRVSSYPRTVRSTTTTRTTKPANSGYETRKQTQTKQQPPQVRQTVNVSNPTSSQKQFKSGEGDRYRSANAGSTNAFSNKPAAPRQTPSVRTTPTSRPVSSTSRSSGFGGSRSSGFGGSRSSGSKRR